MLSNVTNAQKATINCRNFLENLAKGLQPLKSKFLTVTGRDA
jgi:hypothetical protein